MRPASVLALVLLIIAAMACRSKERPAASPAKLPTSTRASSTLASAASTGSIIDSILPIEEYLRRFRRDLAPLDQFGVGAHASRDALIRRLVGAIAARDTAALVGMLLTRREYAYLYYPEHIYAAAPYELDPGTFWALLQLNSAKGLKRLLRRYGGTSLDYLGASCEQLKTVRAPVSEWTCTLHLRVNGVPTSARLFGSLIAREGRYKFASYANDM